MKYRIYIKSLNNFPVDDWAVSAYLGFKQMQVDCILFEDIDEVPKSPYNVVVAHIEDTNKYFERFGLEPKQALNIPEELETQEYLRRWVTHTTMGIFRNNIKRLPIFIKPDGRAKEFMAGVMSREDTIHAFKDVPDDSKVLLSEVVDIISEYRGYVINGELKGLYWYRGDFCVFPNTQLIKQAIRDYKSGPAGYSIDFGVTSDGNTILIECNDGWSLGNYGLESTLYAKLLMARWREIMKF